ncbi:MAG: hypothetical protein CMK95_00560 [Pseudomonas sp.]|nr:hypothetical protein [Pseudomonas sp.]
MKPPVMEEVRREENEQKEEKILYEGTFSLDRKDQLGRSLPHAYTPAEGYIMNMFPTPFLRGQIDLDVEEVAQSCRNLVGEVEDGDVFQEYTTYFNEEIRTKMHGEEWFRFFSNQIKDSYIAFCQNVFEQPVGHLSRNDIHLFAWISIYNGPHSHATHNHVNSHISGTYYVKTEKSNQPIKFYNPNMGAIANHQAVDRTITKEDQPNIFFDGVEGCDSSFYYDPVEGEFLFWPSYIMHSVEPAQEILEDYERIAISFNLKHADIIDNNTTGDNMSYQFLEENHG